MSSANLPTGHTFTRSPKDGPLSRALAASGTQIVDAKEFRMCGELGVLRALLACSLYEVREPPDRRIAPDRSQKCHVAAQLGPQARRDEETPPAMRRAPLRYSLRFLHAPISDQRPSAHEVRRIPWLSLRGISIHLHGP